ncbi:MAG: Gfo/Idh/MocA family oxidoreductase [Lentisphaerae bacterium]|jgi:predicted dehydrogenase|nr:Gfo/Idh/MocA family oxidoreductase [Lentisphaerota bacterium]
MNEQNVAAPLRVAVVGMGGIGNTHSRAYKANPLAKLVAVCDVVKEKADKAATDHGVKAYYSLQDMLANEEIDIVDVSTGGYENGSWHFDPTMEALDAGKHVLCEKPLSNDIDESREMVRYAAERQLYLGCNLNHYFTDTAARARKYMDDGDIGELIYTLFKVGFNGGEATYNFNPSPRFNQPYAHMKAFLTHPFSVMRYFAGDITHIQTFSDRPGFRQNKGDLLVSINSVHCRFANGSIGYLLSHRGEATWGLGGWWSCEVAGSKGTFCIENCVERLTYWPSVKPDDKFGLGQGPIPQVMDTGVKDFGATFPNRINAFLEDVTNGVPLEKLRSSGRDALATMEYIFAVIESYESGGELVRPQPLPLLKGNPAKEKI